MKKLLIVLLCLFMVCGCTKKKDPEPEPEPIPADVKDGTVWIEKLKNFTVRPKDPSKTENDPEFDAFLDKIFKDCLEESYTSMRTSVIDYKALGLEKPEVTWGELEYKGDDLEPYVAQLEELLSFDYSKLSYRQQYDYDMFEYSLYETLAGLCYSQYEFLYSGNGDVLGNVTTFATDLVFHNKEEVDDYITLMEDLDRYLEDCITYTEAQIADGIMMIDDSVDYSDEFLTRFLEKAPEENVLITSFNDRVIALDFLTEDEKTDYMARNALIVTEEVIPVMNKTWDFIKAQRGKVSDPTSMALCNLDKNYAELVYMLHGSNNAPIDEVFQDVQDTFDTLISYYLSGMYDGTASEQYDDIYENPGPALQGDARTILEYLSKALTVAYPDIGEVAFDVDEIDASSASASVLAYYWSAPLDNLDQNIIRTNPNSLKDDIVEAYSTLAHEGFPGHLYQHVYFQKTNPHKFRNTQGFIGYTEGYAVQAQCDAMRFGDIYEGISDLTREMLVFDYCYYFPLYSAIDIGVNYYGWKTDEVKAFLEENYLNGSYADVFINLMIDMPGVYCSYGLGLTNFMKLRDYAKEALGDKFDLVAYNESILKNGPLPFNILKGAVDEYIASVK